MHDQQLQIEEAMFTSAIQRRNSDNFKATKRNAWSESKLGRSYTSAATGRFVSTVRHQMTKANTVGRSVRARDLLIGSGLEPEVVAHLFCKTLYNVMPLVHRKRLKRVTLCKRVADTLHDEMRIRWFAQDKHRRNLLKKLCKQFDARSYPRDWRRRTIRNYFDAEQISWSAWSDRERIAIGYALMIWFRDSTGLILAPRDSKYVDPTPELLAHVEATMLSRVLDFMLYKPMVTPPIPWSLNNLFRGGYLSNKVRPYPLVKGSKTRDAERLLSQDWSRILPAINAMQETPWRVNVDMLEALKWSVDTRGGDFAGLPPSDPKPLPPEPPNYRTDEEVAKAHNKVVFLIRSENREMISKRLMVKATMQVAKEYSSYKAIYFPHNLDSRGRAYPLSAFLQPQGPDWCKALLEFSNGESIATEQDACWLAIAGANAYGNDKVSLQDRVNWVQDNEEDLIFPIANDWRSDLRWTQASEPFQFLRFCLEWKAFCEHGFGYVSHMVVPVDATCSGLQHYSAMLRDEVGGRSVNLVPRLSRQDIYQDVADRAIESLMALSTPEAANVVRLGIGRKEVKRQVMVVPYSGTFSSCMSYTREALAEKYKAGHAPTWNVDDTEENNKHVVLLAQHIWQAIDEIVVKGKEAMRWLTDAARAYSKWANKQGMGNAFDKRMSWVTPDGFEVIHFRPDSKEKRLDTFLDGRVVLTYYEDTKSLSPADMALAVAPNFVHSLDATLLRAAIIKGLELGITDFAMVHDSFGVHAAKMSSFLSKCVKPAFVEMYQGDPLAGLKDRLPPDLDLEPLPTKGTLDLDGVRDSEFFFS
jgi:DNA-directed RNA polymerase